MTVRRIYRGDYPWDLHTVRSNPDENLWAFKVEGADHTVGLVTWTDWRKILLLL